MTSTDTADKVAVNIADDPQLVDTTAYPGRFVTVHVLRPVAGVNLNAGQDGAPKTITIGGATRMRVSSQALKRAWRIWMHQFIAEGERAFRTRKVPGLAARELATTSGIEYADALDLIDVLLAGAGFTIRVTHPEQTAEIPFTTGNTPGLLAAIAADLLHDPQMVDAAAKVAQARADAAEADNGGSRRRGRGRGSSAGATITAPALPSALKRRVHAAFAPGASLEIGLAGRMLTAIPNGRADGAIAVAHAYSVDPIARTVDFFTVKDDAADEWQDGGFDDEAMSAGAHMGELILASGTLYQWACLDRVTLRNNLATNLDGDTLDEAVTAAERLLVTAAAWVLPAAHGRATGAAAAPTLVVAAASDHQPLTAPVFNTPIPAEDTDIEAPERLAAWLRRTSQRHPLNGGTVLWGGLHQAPAFPDTLTVEEI